MASAPPGGGAVLHLRGPTRDATAQSFGHRRVERTIAHDGRTLPVPAATTPSPRSTTCCRSSTRSPSRATASSSAPATSARRPTARPSSTTCSPTSCRARATSRWTPAWPTRPTPAWPTSSRAADVVILSTIRDDWNEPNDSATVRTGRARPGAGPTTSAWSEASGQPVLRRPRPVRALHPLLTRSCAARTVCRPRLRRSRVLEARALSSVAAVRTLVVMPTYDEAENIAELLTPRARRRARLRHPRGRRQQPRRHRRLARAAGEELGQVDVLVRPKKDGLGNAYRHGFRERHRPRATTCSSRWTPTSRTIPPPSRLLLASSTTAPPRSIGSRYVPGRLDPPLAVAPPGPVEVRQPLRLRRPRHDRSTTPPPASAPTTPRRSRRSTSSRPAPKGYGFQIEMAYRVSQTRPAARRGADQLHRPGPGHSKMSLAVMVEELAPGHVVGHPRPGQALVGRGRRPEVLRGRRARSYRRLMPASSPSSTARQDRRSRRRAPGSAGSTCSRGATSTTSRPAAPRCTPPQVARHWAAGRPRGHVAHVVRAGPPATRHPRRVPRHPPRRPLPRLPPGRVLGADRAPRSGRRAARDLERHAVLLAALVPRPEGRDAPPRARRDVADGARRRRTRGWRRLGDTLERPHRAARLPPHAGSSRRRHRRRPRSSPCCGLGRSARSTSCTTASTRCSRRAGAKAAQPDHRRRRPARAGEALRPPASGRSPHARTRVPDLTLTIVGEGYERRALDAVDRASSTPRRGSTFAGRRQPRTTLVGLYRHAWVVVVRVGPRGLGPVAHRGRGVRHARRRHPHRRPRRRGAPTA